MNYKLFLLAGVKKNQIKKPIEIPTIHPKITIFLFPLLIRDAYKVDKNINENIYA